MFSNFIKWLDSLFYTTTITTTTTITRTYYGDAAIQRSTEVEGISKTEDEKIRTVFQKEDDYYVVNERKIKIPDVVKHRRPLTNDGKVDYTTYPSYQHAPFSVSYVHDTRTFAAYDGISLSRNKNVEGITKKSILKTHADYTSAINNENYDRTASAYLNDEILSFVISNDWIYVSFIRNDGSIIQISQSNVRQLESESECIIFAYGYARIILFTLDSVKKDFSQYDEEEMATIILALFLADRV